MTMYVMEMCTCGVCGKETEVSCLSSYTRCGGCDLDSRPPMMHRFTLDLTVCDHCGYVDEDIADGKPELLEYLKSDKYKTCDDFKPRNKEVKQYLRYALIQAYMHNTENEFYAYLNAAWVYDDLVRSKPTNQQYIDGAYECRIRAIKAVNDLLTSDKEVKDIETLKCIKADLLRRVEKYDEVIKEYQNEVFENQLINQIIKFEIELCKKKDHAVHNIAEIKNEKPSLSEKYKKEEEFLRTLANAYITHNADKLISKLPDDFGYDSMWVFESITSKKRYESYIKSKLNVQKQTLNNIEFQLMRAVSDGKPYLMITNSDTPDGGKAVFFVTSDEDGNVRRLDLTSAGFYKLQPMEEDSVIKRTHKSMLEEYPEKKLRFLTADNRSVDYQAVVISDIATAWGLAFIDDIPDNFAAIYDYSSRGPTEVGVYTPDTRISVDFVFLNKENKILKIKSKAAPLSREITRCEDVVTVIELKGGQCEFNNINVGDKIIIKSAYALDVFPGIRATGLFDQKIECSVQED